MTDTNQLPPLPTLRPGDSHMESLIEAAIQGHASTREAMRWLVRQLVPATQPAEVTDEQISAAYLAWCKTSGTPESFARAILALRPSTAPNLSCKSAQARLAAQWGYVRPAAAPMTCHCQTCRPITITDMRMVLCPKCGNKRCPHANDHRNACTGSNEPGQPGSAYPDHHGITAQAKKETP